VLLLSSKDIAGNLDVEYGLGQKDHTRPLSKLTRNTEAVHNGFLPGEQTALINSISKIRWIEDVRDLTVKQVWNFSKSEVPRV